MLENWLWIILFFVAWILIACFSNYTFCYRANNWREITKSRSNNKAVYTLANLSSSNMCIYNKIWKCYIRHYYELHRLKDVSQKLSRYVYHFNWRWKIDFIIRNKFNYHWSKIKMTCIYKQYTKNRN